MYNLNYNLIKSIYIDATNNLDILINSRVNIKGWIRSVRKQKDILFIQIYDGSHAKPIQVILDDKQHELRDLVEPKAQIGACISCSGILVKSPAKGQLVEVIIDEFKIIGEIKELETYLPGIKNIPIEHPRRIQHLRPKFRTYNSIYRIRSTMIKIIHDFFHSKNALNLDPNVITISDCEGAGQVFTITNLLKSNISTIPVKQDSNQIDYKEDFFEKQAFLTVSSQLQLEALCAGMGIVYTMNPSFRAEPSKTKRHLCTFTHLEWEIPFINLNDLMDFSEEMVNYIISQVLIRCKDDLNELNSFMSKGVIKKLNDFIATPFERITYTEAIELIKKYEKNIRKKFDKEIFEFPIWGDDLNSYCERYLSEDIFKKPVFVYNYPRDLKSFYMKQNNKLINNNKTVQGCDLLIPYCGEVIGSSIREENYNILLDEMNRRKMNIEPLKWYLDLRLNGSTPTGGGGLGFDRLVSICTSGFELGNIRDVVPFPVAYKECEY